MLTISLPPSEPEALRYAHTYGVIIPYSSNLKGNKEKPEEERLSFYSAFALNAAIEMYEDKKFQKFLLLSDATFREKRKSTGLLMKEALLHANTTRPICDTDITLLDAMYLNNTPAQVKELAEYQKKNNLYADLFLFITWGFHDERIRSYMQGFGISADTVIVEEAHKYYHPSFQLGKLRRVLPKDFEEREVLLRFLARFDKRGFIPRLLKLFTGPVVTDIKRVQVRNNVSLSREKVNLGFENASGKAKLRQLKEKRKEQ